MKMKTKVVQRSRHRQTVDVAMRKRNLLQRRESRVTKQSRGQRAAAIAAPLFYKEDEFASKFEEKKVAKLTEETEILRVKVENATAEFKEKKREKQEEKER